MRASLRSLYATGLYETIEVAGVRAGNDVSIIFTGTPRLFVGRVNVDGVKDDRLAAVLQSATQLQAGTAYSESKAALAEPEVSTALQNNGYYRGQIATDHGHRPGELAGRPQFRGISRQSRLAWAMWS